jgi:phosphomannomutase
MAQSEQPLSQIHSNLPQYTIIKDKIGIENKQFPLLVKKLKNQFNDGIINSEDGIKFTWENSWIHFRKSNTEPIIRIYAEAKTNKKAESLIQRAKEVIK